MKPSLTPIALAIALLGLNAPAQAQQQASTRETPAPSAKPAPQQGGMAQVEVKGGLQDYDARREDTASKTVITQEEILKYGDTNVFEVLKRAPGVTVIGNSIRMRGLGNGYTQVLVNGERPPPGFSMDTLAPEQIEKIEVIRAATAEHSMQAIAGTVNIVLKKVVAKAQRDLRINTARSDEQKNLFMLGTLADRSGNLSYYLNGMVGRNLNASQTEGTDQFSLPDGRIAQLRDKRGQSSNRNSMAGLQPRLNWKLANDDQLNLSAFMQASRSDNASSGSTVNRVGSFPQPDYVERSGTNESEARFVGGEANWVAKLAGGKLDAKLSASRGRVDNESRSLSATADGATRLRRDNDANSRFNNYGSTGKYSRTVLDGHALATGWEVNRQGTEDANLRTEGLLGTQPALIRERFSPEVTKLAAYVQDEWNITKEWSIYQGVRWEGIRTDSAGTGLRTTRSRNHVLSPVAQTLYKFPDKSGRQLRMALTRTFKAPSTNQLSARRYESDLNTRFNPDNSGNPNLRPELANGIDLTYEHFWAPGAVFSVSASRRNIKDYIRSRLTEDARGYWLVQPVNDGDAQVRTLDVELKFPLKAVLKDGPPFDFRASVNRNWSKVESVPGPDNRLDQQVPLTAVLGADYREDKYSAGASFSYRAGGSVRVSEQQFGWLQQRRELEAYLLYKVRTGVQLRLAVSNALGEDNLSQSRYQDLSGTSQTWTRSPGSPRLQANLELKF
ncbi:TonB-dependent receptor plug domain-containing protein [Pseudoduganella namucuonensis]|uniref:Outer membrane receptor for ferrienterochelin and colicins n=1 Tax=Pseudoduganella namucuonensis TaxID=1035707 RepID=A0A1I7JCT3_9BURK|nr:TonB-dependent receptor [Pseudoduganella namucuonensis]SFU82996.1 Outer membrane receptor for ferrienterochelin and colicins [Pseudoduganella namucuonensis]